MNIKNIEWENSQIPYHGDKAVAIKEEWLETSHHLTCKESWGVARKEYWSQEKLVKWDGLQPAYISSTAFCMTDTCPVHFTT